MPRDELEKEKRNNERRKLRGSRRKEAVKEAEEEKYWVAPEALGKQRRKQFSCPEEQVITEEQWWRSNNRNPLAENSNCLSKSTAGKLVQGKAYERTAPESGSEEVENIRVHGGTSLSSLHMVIPSSAALVHAGWRFNGRLHVCQRTWGS